MLNHAFRDPLLFTRAAWMWSAVPPAAAIVTVVLSLALVAQIFETRMRRALPES
jgi:ABC-type dipeptide/oligopeptide/nickel transport system permease subunit